MRREIETLLDRWREIAPVDFRAVLPSKNSPFGLTLEGLADFRGAALETSLHKLVLKELDLSYTKMRRGQFVSQVENCLFDGCVYDCTVSRSFLECSFVGANLNGSNLQGMFCKCDFSGAKLTQTLSSETVFERCVFRNTNLKGGNLYRSRFLACVFDNCKLGGGSLAMSAFTDCTISGCDFSTTVMERVKGL